jgi:hypothetical protein
MDVQVDLHVLNLRTSAAAHDYLSRYPQSEACAERVSLADRVVAIACCVCSASKQRLPEVQLDAEIDSQSDVGRSRAATPDRVID